MAKFKKTSSTLSDKYSQSLEFAKHTLQAVKFEGKETYDASRILLKMIRNKDVTEDDKQFLKNQSVDLLKIIPIIAFQGIPGSIALTPLLIKLGKKYDIDILPNSHKK